MDRYIGLDAHASSCTVSVIGPSGRHLASHVIETNARALISTIEKIPRQRRLCLEEGALAGWLIWPRPTSCLSATMCASRIASRACCGRVGSRWQAPR